VPGMIPALHHEAVLGTDLTRNKTHLDTPLAI
jgi:hypothetical protein